LPNRDVIRVLFVCLGNICRSPTAEGVFTALLAERGFTAAVEADSCGTGDWHVGSPPDARAILEAARRGYDLSHLQARVLQTHDFERFDYILAMDRANLEVLQAMCPVDYSGRLDLFLSYAADSGLDEVPDPYYGGDEGFSQVLDIIEVASEGLLEALRRDLEGSNEHSSP
jgi:protein-tyrosine phosphatase